MTVVVLAGDLPFVNLPVVDLSHVDLSHVDLSVILVALLGAAAVLVWPSRTRRVWTPGSGARALRRRPRGRPEDGILPLVPEACDLVALALLGGGSLSGAVLRAGEVLPGRAGEQLREVGRLLGQGEDEHRAWWHADACWSTARSSLQLADVAGVAPGEALRHAARDLRRDAVADVEVAATRLGVRLVLPLGLAFLPAFVLTTVVPIVLALTRDLLR